MSPTTRRTQTRVHRIARRFIFFAMATAIVLAALLSPNALIRNVSAAPGAKDLSFGQNGEVPLWAAYSVSRLALQPDGKIVVAHNASFGQYEFVLLDRYLPSGELEWRKLVPGTLAQGVVSQYARLRVLIRPDGKIVVARTKNLHTVIVLFNSNGSVDADFGSGGLLEIGDSIDMGVLPDNRLVQLQGFSFSVYDAVGAFVQTVNLPYISIPDLGTLAVGMDGRIVTVYNNHMAIFNADFTPDTSFCPGGLCTLVLPGGRPTIANDGKIIVVMIDATVARYLPNGSVDTDFGTAGLFQLGTTDFYFRDVEVDDAGRVLVGMSSFNPYSNVWVIEADGSSAELMIQAGGLPAQIHDIALQENGKLLVSGWLLAGGILQRYHYSDERASVADLRFETTRTSPAATVGRGDLITYNLRVVNNGPAKAGHVTFENAVPSGTTFVSFKAPDGWVTYQKPRLFLGKVSCSGYRLESGQSVQFQLTVRVNPRVVDGTPIVNTSHVGSLVPDPIPLNNTAISILTVQ